jgi:predicted nuclease with RNAse H fold
VKRPFTRFIGIDLGGGRGKTTAVAEIRRTWIPQVPRIAQISQIDPGSRSERAERAAVIEVATRSTKQPWTDETLVERLVAASPEATVIAIDAPLTRTACSRCERPVCPGMEACPEPAVVWLRTEGRALVRQSSSLAVGGGSRPAHTSPAAQARLVPYAHRATDVLLTYGRGLLPVPALGAVNGAISARAGQLRRRLRGAGFELHHNLVEVSPTATITALCGPRAARGYKRDADPWVTRASILEQLRDLTFAPQSRMAREDVLQSDHCFDAVIAAYTAYLWARDGWSAPDGCFVDDGWIVAPP